MWTVREHWSGRQVWRVREHRSGRQVWTVREHWSSQQVWTVREHWSGRQVWTVHEPMCGQPPGVRQLLLSVCGRGEFSCSDGTCIAISSRCDQQAHCTDSSDETNCKILALPVDYKVRQYLQSCLTMNNFVFHMNDKTRKQINFEKLRKLLYLKFMFQLQFYYVLYLYHMLLI